MEFRRSQCLLQDCSLPSLSLSPSCCGATSEPAGITVSHLSECVLWRHTEAQKDLCQYKVVQCFYIISFLSIYFLFLLLTCTFFCPWLFLLYWQLPLPSPTFPAFMFFTWPQAWYQNHPNTNFCVSLLLLWRLIIHTVSFDPGCTW